MGLHGHLLAPKRVRARPMPRPEPRLRSEVDLKVKPLVDRAREGGAA